MRVLGLDSAWGGCVACIAEDGRLILEEQVSAEQGLAALIAPLVARLVAGAGQPGLAAVVVGPGSFTGLRAGISVVLGLACARGIRAVGVTASEAWGDQVREIGARVLWTVMPARRGRVFIDQGSGFCSWPTDALPDAAGPLALAGPAAQEAAGPLAARGVDVLLTTALRPHAADVAEAGLRRWRGELPPLAAVPLYVDEPEARPHARTP